MILRMFPHSNLQGMLSHCTHCVSEQRNQYICEIYLRSCAHATTEQLPEAAFAAALSNGVDSLMAILFNSAFRDFKLTSIYVKTQDDCNMKSTYTFKNEGYFGI